MFTCRYEEIKEKLTPYLRKCGFNPKTDIYYLPVSGLTGANLKDTNVDTCPWYKWVFILSNSHTNGSNHWLSSLFLLVVRGLSLIQYLEKLPPVSRMADGPVRMPVVDRYRVCAHCSCLTLHLALHRFMLWVSFQDMGTIVLGKIESGTICKGQVLTLMPNKVSLVLSAVCLVYVWLEQLVSCWF